MKKNIAVALLGASLASSAVLADDCGPSFYVGAEAQYNTFRLTNRSDLETGIPGLRRWRSLWGGGIFAGSKFNDCLGIELGINTTARKTVHSAAITDVTEFDFVNNTVTGTTGTWSLRVQSTTGYADLLGYLPAFDCVDLIGSLGVGIVNFNHRAQLVTATGNVFTDNGSRDLTRVALRLGIGAQYKFDDCVGARVMVRYSLLGDNNRNGGNAGFAQHNVQVGLGLFYQF